MTGKHSSVKYSGAMSFRQHRLHDDSDAKLNAVGQCGVSWYGASHGHTCGCSRQRVQTVVFKTRYDPEI